MSIFGGKCYRKFKVFDAGYMISFANVVSIFSHIEVENKKDSGTDKMLLEYINTHKHGDCNVGLVRINTPKRSYQNYTKG